MTVEPLDEIRRTWLEKGFEVPNEEFAAFARERVDFERVLEQARTDALARDRLRELYLTCACARGMPAAHAVFDQDYLQPAASAVRAVDAGRAFVAEVMQELRVKLLMPPFQVAQFKGESSLHTWLRTVATRTALNQRRGKAPAEISSGEWSRLPAAVIDADLGILGSRFRAEFAEAFQGAWLELEKEQRNLLRLHLLDGLGIDQLAPVFQVHRSTAARKIAQAREELAKATKQLLVQKLSIPPRELEEILELVRSRLDVSMRRFLEQTGD